MGVTRAIYMVAHYRKLVGPWVMWFEMCHIEAHFKDNISVNVPLNRNEEKSSGNE